MVKNPLVGGGRAMVCFVANYGVEEIREKPWLVKPVCEALDTCDYGLHLRTDCAGTHFNASNFRTLFAEFPECLVSKLFSVYYD
jgi:hypothetical protein